MSNKEVASRGWLVTLGETMLPGLRFLLFALLLAGSPETQNRPAPGPWPLFDCYYSNFSTIPATIGRVVSGWGVITAYDRTMGPAWVPAPVVEEGRTFFEAEDLSPKFRGEQAGSIERSVMSEKAALVADAARGVVTREDGGARDAGSRQCVAYIYDRERTRYEVVYLGSYGDTNDERVTNDAPAARELLEWLKEVGIAEMEIRSERPTSNFAAVLSADDTAIYRAVLEHTILPEARRLNPHARPFAPLWMLDATLPVCPASDQRQRLEQCAERHIADALDIGVELTGFLAFEGVLSGAVRVQLGKSFRVRNARSHPFPRLDSPDLGYVSIEDVYGPREHAYEKIDTRSGQHLGLTGFSRPAYAESGQAVAYAVYRCGGMCGSGWKLLLDSAAGTWRVRAVDIVWLS